MSALVKTYIALVPLMLTLDLLWLGVIMRNFYQTNLAHLVGPGVMWAPAVVFYVLFTLGLVFFALVPGVASGSLARTVFLGAAFAFFAYATYDLTNQATLRDWPLVVTLVDVAWGAFVGGVLGGVGFWLHRLFS